MDSIPSDGDQPGIMTRPDLELDIRWFTISEAARLIGKSTRQTRRYATDPTIISRRSGHRLLIHGDDIPKLRDLANSGPDTASDSAEEMANVVHYRTLLLEKDQHLADALRENGELRARLAQTPNPTPLLRDFDTRLAE